MHIKFEKWRHYLSIDDTTIATLVKFQPLLTPHMDALMDAVYRKIATSPAATEAFRDGASVAKARHLQQAHWQNYVFAGRFDEDYLRAVRRIGQIHYQRGIDLRLYSGTYLVVMNELVDIVTKTMKDQPEQARLHIRALNTAIFLDQGLATSVYYESLLGAVEDMASELNFALARAGEYRDNETGKHITRMSRMCAALARAFGRDSRWCQMIQVASPLHDVGKIGIPDSILLKPARLSADEFDTMRQHPAIGGEIIPDHSSEVIRMARRISLTHHERWDGQGYPAGLKGDEIPLEGRIAAICDVYDALVSPRPYKRAWSQDEALRYIDENSGSHFDPELVARFRSIIGEIDRIQAELAD